jgi:nucleotide-binding universal stress UspA family protein
MPIAKPNLRLFLKNILFTTDFSAASEAALPYALALARWYGSKILVAHSVPPEPVLSMPIEPMPVDLDVEWQSARRKMEKFMASHVFESTAHESVLQQGELWEVISNVIQRNNVDMVVLGTHGREGLSKLVMGSASEQIFRKAPCPVLTVGPNAAHPVPEFQSWKNILFATDFSPGSLNALPYALSLAEENQATLILLHLIPLVPVQERETVENGARKRMELLVPIDAAAWCKPEFLVRFDFPADGILTVAKKRNVDLIVMGVRNTGSPRLSAHLPWAVAHDMVCRAQCPVLTVRG